MCSPFTIKIVTVHPPCFFSIFYQASIYNAGRIIIGSNVRVDDFAVISAGKGGVNIGNYVHIAAQALLVGNGKITMGDFSGVSSKVSVYSSSDDYSGESLTNPMVHDVYKNVDEGDVYIGKHSIIGAGSVVMPGVSVGDGAAVGALSFVNKNCDEFFIYMGAPAKKTKKRKLVLLDKERAFLKKINDAKCR